MKFAKDQVARQFSRAAKTYDHAAQLQNEMAQRLIEEIPAQRIGKLVDLGCGTGWALQQIAKLNRFELTAIDLAPGMIEIAKTRVPGAVFHCGDLESTPLENDSADLVFSNAAIQWCDLASAISEFKRLCRPGGLILFSTFGPETLKEIRTAWRAVETRPNRVHEFESAQAVESAINQVGLQSPHVRSHTHQLTFHSVDDLLASIKKLGATNASSTRPTGLLGTGRYRDFRAFLEQQLTHDHRLKLTFECIFASCRV